MASERLSKLQKWILKRAYENNYTSKQDIKHYFNKGRDKDARSFRVFNSGYPLTTSERVTVHKSLKNLLQKGLLTREGVSGYVLTERGFDALKVNDSVTHNKNVSFKDYQGRVEQVRQEYDVWLKSLKTMCSTLARKRA